MNSHRSTTSNLSGISGFLVPLEGVPLHLLHGTLCYGKISTIIHLPLVMFYSCHKNNQFPVWMEAVSKLIKVRGGSFIWNLGKFWNSEQTAWTGKIITSRWTRCHLFLSSNIACLMCYSRWLLNGSRQPTTLLNYCSAAVVSGNISWMLFPLVYSAYAVAQISTCTWLIRASAE